MEGLNATVPDSVRAQAVAEVFELRTTFYVGLASYTVLLYDHLLTLGDEVKYIWMKRKRSPLVWLFFLNRYLAPLAFIGNLYAYFSNTFDYDKCKHFVRYEGAMTVIGINIASLMMLLRVYAMYEKRKAIVVLVALVFVLELGTNAWLLTHGIAVHHSPSIKGLPQACTMIFDSSKVRGVAASASAWTPLVFDTLVLGLTVYRTYSGIRNPTVGRTMWILLKEGVMYYSVIFCVTLVLTLMIVSAPPGIQNICAQMEYLLTVAMMSRITLHLRRTAHKQDNFDSSYDLTSSMMTASGRPRSPIAFAHRLPTINSANNTPFTISIQSQTVMHDDHGDEIYDVARRKSSLPQAPGLAKLPTPPPTRRPRSAGNGHGHRHSLGPGEWYEFAPLRFQADRERELERDRKARLDDGDV